VAKEVPVRSRYTRAVLFALALLAIFAGGYVIGRLAFTLFS